MGGKMSNCDPSENFCPFDAKCVFPCAFSEIAVGKINVDEEVELAMEFGVASIPTLVVVEHGKVMNKAIGYMPKAEIEELLG